MAKKGKRSTPTELDPLFSRGTISEDMYADFWSQWWKLRSQDSKDELIRFYMQESIEERVAEAIEEGEGVATLPLHGNITKKRKEAERQAEIIGGYVARRNKRGQFSKRGRFYQAIKRRTKR